jgi:type II secretory pathway pseudopilin PulG
MFRKRAGDESGTTLVEVLVAVVILGSAVAALLGGFTTSIYSSVLHRSKAKTEVVLREYAEKLKNGGYLTCASPTPTPITEDAYTAQVTSIKYWQTGSTNPATFVVCGTPDPSTSGLGRISMTSTSPDGKVSQTLDVYLRK